MAQKRLGKYASTFPMVLISGDAENIHDTRVASRRMQQVMNLFFPPPRSAKAAKLCALCARFAAPSAPVATSTSILDLIQEKIDAAGSDIAREAWAQVRDAITETRAAELSRAREASSKRILSH